MSFELLAYEGRLKQVLDEKAAIKEAELREEEAWQEGQVDSVMTFLEVKFPTQDTRDICKGLHSIKESVDLEKREKELFQVKRGMRQ